MPETTLPPAPRVQATSIVRTALSSDLTSQHDLPPELLRRVIDLSEPNDDRAGNWTIRRARLLELACVDRSFYDAAADLFACHLVFSREDELRDYLRKAEAGVVDAGSVRALSFEIGIIGSDAARTVAQILGICEHARTVRVRRTDMLQHTAALRVDRLVIDLITSQATMAGVWRALEASSRPLSLTILRNLTLLGQLPCELTDRLIELSLGTEAVSGLSLSDDDLFASPALRLRTLELRALDLLDHLLDSETFFGVCIRATPVLEQLTAISAISFTADKLIEVPRPVPTYRLVLGPEQSTTWAHQPFGAGGHALVEEYGKRLASGAAPALRRLTIDVSALGFDPTCASGKQAALELTDACANRNIDLIFVT